MTPRSVFMTGSTGYIGTRLAPLLTKRGHRVRCVARQGSERRLPPGSTCVIANALDGDSYASELLPGDTFVHLVGVAHPSPAKARQFEEIDYRSAMEAIRVAADRGASQFVYVSVAHPGPVMKAYIDVRMRIESALRDAGLMATILRPFYVLGPGHYWPYALKPFYWAAERMGSAGAKRLALVTISQMLNALVHAVENPPQGQASFEPSHIRECKITR